MTEPAVLIDVTDDTLFGRNAVLGGVRLDAGQRPGPLAPEPDGPGFWAVTRYRDITAVYADHETFSSRQGMRLGSDAAAVSAVAQRMLIVSDPPDHNRSSRSSPAPSAREMPKLEKSPTGPYAAGRRRRRAGEVDFIEVAKLLTELRVCAVMGMPAEEWAWVGQTTPPPSRARTSRPGAREQRDLPVLRGTAARGARRRRERLHQPDRPDSAPPTARTPPHRRRDRLQLQRGPVRRQRDHPVLHRRRGARPRRAPRPVGTPCGGGTVREKTPRPSKRSCAGPSRACTPCVPCTAGDHRRRPDEPR